MHSGESPSHAPRDKAGEYYCLGGDYTIIDIAPLARRISVRMVGYPACWTGLIAYKAWPHAMGMALHRWCA